MHDLVNVELNTQERGVLLRGLRYVRSAIMLESRDPKPDDELRRQDELDDIQSLSMRLNSKDSLGVRY